MILLLPTRHKTSALLPRLLAISTLMVSATFLALPTLRAETTQYSGATQITSLPKTFSTPGTYYLAQDFTVNMSSGTCFDIETSGVTIDLNGHTLANTNGTATTAYALYASNFANIVVKNGTIKGFYIGIDIGPYSATTSYGHLLQNINFVQNTLCGPSISGVGCRIYQCRAVLQGGTTTNSIYYNFVISGTGNSIEDCDISSTTGSGTAIGIDVAGSDNFVLNNRISGVADGILGQGGGANVYRYRDNLTSNISNAAYTGGTNVGNNN